MLKIISLVVIGMAVLGLLTGKVMAGSRGFKANYYSREDSPFLFYGFVFVYLIMGVFLFFAR